MDEVDREALRQMLQRRRRIRPDGNFMMQQFMIAVAIVRVGETVMRPLARVVPFPVYVIFVAWVSLGMATAFSRKSQKITLWASIVLALLAIMSLVVR